MIKVSKKNSSFFLLKKVWKHLGVNRKRQFIVLAILMVLTAISEVIGLGILIPFITILTSPDIILKYSIFKWLMEKFNILSTAELVLPLTVLLIASAFLSGAMRLVQLWLNGKLSYLAGADISSEIYRRTLYQPYSTHVSRNGSTVISGLTVKVNGTVVSFYYFLTLISSTVLFVIMTIALVLINPQVALIVAGICGLFYGILSKVTGARLRRNSVLISDGQSLVVKSLQEGLGGIRDILLDGTQPVYYNIYHKADKKLREIQGQNLFINGSPRFVMESAGIILIGILAYVLHNQEGGVVRALPLLATLAVGAQRLLPCLQLMFAMWSAIEANHASLADTVEFLDQPVTEEVTKKDIQPLDLQKVIEFKDVYFRYHPDGPWVLEGFNLTIPKGSRVGFVGATGSGKSTALDLLMCLLKPTSGQINVDGNLIAGDLVRRWQKSIAHVPQNIFLSDASLAENIAFGIPKEEIDFSLLKLASEQAQVAEFVESRSGSYDVCVGERGVRLSGGQRQRIGIARALYKKARVLIFDEATSALDSMTEKKVMESIEGLNKDLTILIIAHRLSTIQKCDFIVMMDAGKVAAIGSYDELLKSNGTFREMVHATS